MSCRLHAVLLWHHTPWCHAQRRSAHRRHARDLHWESRAHVNRLHETVVHGHVLLLLHACLYHARRWHRPADRLRPCTALWHTRLLLLRLLLLLPRRLQQAIEQLARLQVPLLLW
jgi:hypothetical protein